MAKDGLSILVMGWTFEIGGQTITAVAAPAVDGRTIREAIAHDLAELGPVPAGLQRRLNEPLTRYVVLPLESIVTIDRAAGAPDQIGPASAEAPPQ